MHTRIVRTRIVGPGFREVFVKNITLSADASLIVAARERAAAERTTLNAEFRRWLADYAGRTNQADAAMATIRLLRGDIATGGRRFTRDEMNER